MVGRRAAATVVATAVAARLLAGCGGSGPSATEAQICGVAREFAVDVGTDTPSWEASETAMERAVFDQQGRVAEVAQELVAAKGDINRSWFGPFVALAEVCAEVGLPVVSDPQELICNFQTGRRERYPGVEYDVDYCTLPAG